MQHKPVKTSHSLFEIPFIDDFSRQYARLGVVTADAEILSEIGAVAVTFHVLDLNLETAATAAEMLVTQDHRFAGRKKID